ncbi:G-protein coupled receptor GRL101-like [Antedon mediterranea]|uniref:G-protein coupled receptor GRL101-like n=1 Tax=Antedon mediterranea TaxID=105859 RepID=UPI003AF8BFAC
MLIFQHIKFLILLVLSRCYTAKAFSGSGLGPPAPDGGPPAPGGGPPAPVLPTRSQPPRGKKYVVVEVVVVLVPIPSTECLVNAKGKSSYFGDTTRIITLECYKWNNDTVAQVLRSYEGKEEPTKVTLEIRQMETLPNNAFAGFSAFYSLDIRGNNLQVYRERTFEELKNIKQLYSDIFRLCCLVGEIEVCEPTDAFSSCDDLLRREILRILMMIIAISSVIGNVFVIISRIVKKESTVDSILLTNLAVSDLLMAVYLLIIAGADLHYRGRYAKVAKDWKNSFLCSFAGAISTLSGECSVFSLMVMSVDRAVNIVSPFSTKRLKRTKCRIIIGIAWLVWGALSFLPLVSNNIGISYFGENYYGKQSVCLALPLTRSRLPGWEYATAIFIAFNGLGFFVIAASYLTIFLSVKRSAATVNRIQKREEEIKMAMKLAFIVFTDFCCWCPVIVMAICSEMQWLRIPDEIYVWAATFIIPINSSVNPYLFTIVNMCTSKRQR